MPVIIVLLLGGGAFIAWRALRPRRAATLNPRLHVPYEQALADANAARQQWVDHAVQTGEVSARTYSGAEVPPGGDDGVALAPRLREVDTPDLVEAPMPVPPPIIPTGEAITAAHRAATGTTAAPPVPEPPAPPPMLRLPVPTAPQTATSGVVPAPITSPPPRSREP